MSKHINTYPRRESNPVYNNIGKIGYYYHSDNNYSRDFEKPGDKHIITYTHGDTNYQKACIEAFRLLSSNVYTPMHLSTKFNQELCKTLVIKYGLSCSDCNLECELHDLEALK